MNLLHHALRAANQPQPSGLPTTGPTATSLLVLGGGGVLGSAVLEQALVAGRFLSVFALVDEPLQSSLRGLVPLPRAELGSAAHRHVHTAIVIFERRRHSNGRDAAFTQPQPAQLVDWARALKRQGVGALIVVVPHAPALMPLALTRGLASLDEGEVTALGFEQLVFVRAAQTHSGPAVDGMLPRLAQWWLSQLRLMVPNADQALRSATLAAAMVLLARQLPHAPVGTRVLAPHTLWPMTKDMARLPEALHNWLHGSGMSGADDEGVPSEAEAPGQP